MRLARKFSGLPDARLQEIFHELKREGSHISPPTIEDWKTWANRQAVLIKYMPGANAVSRQESMADLLQAVKETIDPGTFYAWQRLEARARQDAVINKIDPSRINKLVVSNGDLSQYELGDDGRPNLIWYVGYGSNLSQSRMLNYIEGTVPGGLSSKQEGCRDNQSPKRTVGLEIQGKMHFAGRTSRWGGGGSAYIDRDPRARSLAKGFLITMEQLDDIVAQENGREVGSVRLDTAKVLAEGSMLVDPTFVYCELVHLGDYDGVPAFTLTGDFSAQDSLEHSRFEAVASDISTRAPNLNYIRTIGIGLEETFGLSKAQQAEYLRGASGLEDTSKGDIVKVLESPLENRVQRLARLEIQLVNEKDPKQIIYLNEEISRIKEKEAETKANADEKANAKLTEAKES